MGESIKDKVAIIGMGCTKFGERWDQSVTDLMVDAAYEAYEDAGVEPSAIEAAWVGTFYEYSGMAGMAAGVPLRLQYKPVTRVENMCCTGSDALRNASYAVAARVYDVALAIGVEKIKDQGLSGLQGASGAGVHTYPNVAPPGIFAMLATRLCSLRPQPRRWEGDDRENLGEESPQRIVEPQGPSPQEGHRGAGPQRPHHRLAPGPFRLLRRERRVGGRYRRAR